MRHSRQILNGDFQSPMAKILNGFDQKSKGALSHALAEKLGDRNQIVMNIS